MSSVKVCDVEIQQLAQIADMWAEIDSVFERYLMILKNVKEHAVKCGEIHDAIVSLYDFAETYYKYANGLGKNVSKDALEFLDKIEDIDLDLYNAVKL